MGATASQLHEKSPDSGRYFGNELGIYFLLQPDLADPSELRTPPNSGIHFNDREYPLFIEVSL